MQEMCLKKGKRDQKLSFEIIFNAGKYLKVLS